MLSVIRFGPFPWKGSVWIVFGDVPGDGAGGHRQRAGQVHLAGAASSGEVSVLGTYYYLVGAGGDSGAGVDAGSAAGLDEAGAGSLENLYVAFAARVLAGFLRAELNPELDVF